MPSRIPEAASGTVPVETRAALRRDPAVREIVRALRRLLAEVPDPAAGHPGVLIACSGGADSSALALALATMKRPPIAIAHVLHDMRPRGQAQADRDAARALAATLGVEFVEAEVCITGRRGNPEALARRERYAALAALARDRGLGVIATAHHAGDQLESILMGLLRGAGPAGLAGIARRRPLAGAAATEQPVTIARPMLAISRQDCERICRLAGWVWREDATNQDRSRLRAAIRHGIVPELAQLRPGVQRRAARSAALLRDAAALVEDRAAELWSNAQTSNSSARSIRFARATLRVEREVVVGAIVRRAVRQLGRGRGMDRLSARVMDPIVTAIRSADTDPKQFRLAGRRGNAAAGIVVRVTARSVEFAQGASDE